MGKDDIIQAESVKGSEAFFSTYGKQFQSAIVSGSDQMELRAICQVREIDRYFVEILGSPVDKATDIAQLIQTNGWEKPQCVYIGDSHNDP